MAAVIFLAGMLCGGSLATWLGPAALTLFQTAANVQLIEKRPVRLRCARRWPDGRFGMGGVVLAEAGDRALPDAVQKRHVFKLVAGLVVLVTAKREDDHRFCP